MEFSRPLDRYPFIRTSRIDELREAIARIYARPILQPGGKTRVLDAVLNHCRLQSISIGYGTYGAPVSVEFPAVERFTQLIPVRGAGEIARGKTVIEIGGAGGAAISPDMGYKAEYDENYGHIVMQIDGRALAAKLAALVGEPVNGPLRIEPRVDLKRPGAAALSAYIPRLAQTLTEANQPFPQWWVSQTEQFLMVMFLYAHQHNYSHLLERDPVEAAPWQVRRTEEYIESNWRQPISLEDLAQVSGVGALDLFRMFKKIRGYSPFEFLARVRARYDGGRP